MLTELTSSFLYEIYFIKTLQIQYIYSLKLHMYIYFHEIVEWIGFFHLLFTNFISSCLSELQNLQRMSNGDILYCVNCCYKCVMSFQTACGHAFIVYMYLIIKSFKPFNDVCFLAFTDILDLKCAVSMDNAQSSCLMWLLDWHIRMFPHGTVTFAGVYWNPSQL